MLSADFALHERRGVGEENFKQVLVPLVRSQEEDLAEEGHFLELELLDFHILRLVPLVEQLLEHLEHHGVLQLIN